MVKQQEVGPDAQDAVGRGQATGDAGDAWGGCNTTPDAQDARDIRYNQGASGRGAVRSDAG